MNRVWRPKQPAVFSGMLICVRNDVSKTLHDVQWRAELVMEFEIFMSVTDAGCDIGFWQWH